MPLYERIDTSDFLCPFRGAFAQTLDELVTPAKWVYDQVVAKPMKEVETN